ncbi:MAG TPA: adenine phosphoribosyltransferase [Candidatus Omnitrophota bacterium]|jgi:adenine phosphoribosyltransferase|nr:MAG: Adenine phosphoribosyltransferase [Candidatus Omnitrophica bacterium ADurb.Bin314]HOE68505.1 adenine phosphoribosyltransferase [Candidatus Omnitrophota bacterium]HPW64780.1 adenine phosphoribosyltransferase [Candidatus Omnitrophota bacterium]HQB94146.1 adenine phosphoribosyltransferase [Candidatus Omnitrophota bacterium]
MSIASLKARVRDIPDFPKKGILFRDITPLLKEPASFREIVARLTAAVRKSGAKVVVGIESRGFIFGAPVAAKLGIGFVPIRKKGKLPWRTRQVACTLEYGQEILEIHADAVKRGQKVVVIDDLLATGGTAQAAAKLVEKLGGKVALLAFVIELEFLKGREKLGRYDALSLLKY